MGKKALITSFVLFMPGFILASLKSVICEGFMSSVLLNSSPRFRKRKLSHALRVKPRSIFFCVFV